jgi:lipopolysaccharide transport system ATP-binding protein
MALPAISAENLSKCYLVGHRSERDQGRQVVQGDVIEEYWALKDVSFEVGQGEVLGIIGRNGAAYGM